MWPCIGALVFVIFWIASLVVYDLIVLHAIKDVELRPLMYFANQMGFPLMWDIAPALVVMWAIYCANKKGVADFFWVVFFGIASSELFRVAANAMLGTRIQGLPAKLMMITFIPTAVLILCGGVLCWIFRQQRKEKIHNEEN